MAKFRNKPVVIEAEQFISGMPLPSGVTERYDHLGQRTVPMLGFIQVMNGDWIVTAPDGVRFLWRDETFREAYEPVDSEPTVIDSRGNVHGHPLPDLRGLRDPNGLY